MEWNCNGSFHTADLQLGDVNLKVFNIIKGINESKTDLFHVKKRFISCKCRYEFDDRKCNLKQKWNNKCRIYPMSRNYAWKPSMWACQRGKDWDIE